MISIPEKYADILNAKILAYLATIGPNGAPHVSPMWFRWDGERLQFSTTNARQKSKNIKRQPFVSVAITDPDNPYRSIEIRGTATAELDPEFRVAHLVSRKYTGSDATPEMLDAHEGRVAVTVTPEKLLVFEA